jgi:hypothetical protein
MSSALSRYSLRSLIIAASLVFTQPTRVPEIVSPSDTVAVLTEKENIRGCITDLQAGKNLMENNSYEKIAVSRGMVCGLESRHNIQVVHISAPIIPYNDFAEVDVIHWSGQNPPLKMTGDPLIDTGLFELNNRPVGYEALIVFQGTKDHHLYTTRFQLGQGPMQWNATYDKGLPNVEKNYAPDPLAGPLRSEDARKLEQLSGVIEFMRKFVPDRLTP